MACRSMKNYEQFTRVAYLAIDAMRRINTLLWRTLIIIIIIIIMSQFLPRKIKNPQMRRLA